MNTNELLEKFRSDQAFAAKYRNLGDLNEIQAQLKADGYDVSTDDIRAGIKQLQPATGELSEAELAGVAGGAMATQFKATKCPKCGSKNWSQIGYEFGNARYRLHCNDCGKEWWETEDDW